MSVRRGELPSVTGLPRFAGGRTDLAVGYNLEELLVALSLELGGFAAGQGPRRLDAVV
jgi:hypothetical protein